VSCSSVDFKIINISNSCWKLCLTECIKFDYLLEAFLVYILLHIVDIFKKDEDDISYVMCQKCAS